MFNYTEYQKEISSLDSIPLICEFESMIIDSITSKDISIFSKIAVIRNELEKRLEK